MCGPTVCQPVSDDLLYDLLYDLGGPGFDPAHPVLLDAHQGLCLLIDAPG